MACGATQHTTPRHGSEPAGGSGRIEERSLSDRPPLSIIERQGDPEAAIGFASLAENAADAHAAFGQLLHERLTRAGFLSEVVVHGLGFELTLLAEKPERARAALAALLQALQKPVSDAELNGRFLRADKSQTPPSAVARCSAELAASSEALDGARLERERVATFARDRSALAVVGEPAMADAVVDALGDGPDWPELGRVGTRLPERSLTEVLRGERATLSVALTVGDPNRALGAAERLGEAQGALTARLAALGAGLHVRRVTATAHVSGACLRVDSDVDASPVPDSLRLGFAIQAIGDEAALALTEAPIENRLEGNAVSAPDPRRAARAAAYRALIQPAPPLVTQRLVALTIPEAGPSPGSLDAAVQQARAAAPVLELGLRVESGQPGIWALVASPCATHTERAESAGLTALLFTAASLAAPQKVRLEPWLGGSGAGLLGFTERAAGESDAQAAARLSDALGRALVAAPSAVDVAQARADLIKSGGGQQRPLLESLLEALAPGHAGALLPRGSVTSLEAASRETVLARQRELLRLPHRLAVLSPSKALDLNVMAERLSRWLMTPDARRVSPCGNEASPPARGELSLSAPADTPEGSYLAFRISAKAGAEATLLAELLNLPGGALERTLAEPDLVGAARVMALGTSTARALVVQISAFEGREGEALTRIQKLFERLAAGGVWSAAELETAVAERRAQQRLRALDPRYRLVRLLEPTGDGAADPAALRRLAATLRPESAIVARTTARATPPSAGKSAPSR